MCPNEQIPKINFIDRVETAFRQYDERRVEDGIEDGDLPMVSTLPFEDPDEIVAGHNNHVNHLISSDVWNNLIEGNRTTNGNPDVHPGDYENMFVIHGLRRQSERPLFDPALEPPQLFRDFMSNFLRTALYNETHDIIPEWEVLKQWPLIDAMVEYFMPVRLDLNSWAGRQMLPLLAEKITGQRERSHEIQSWHQGLGSDNWAEKLSEPDGKPLPRLSYIGTPEPGHIVWTPQGGLPRATSDEMVKYYRAINKTLRKAEQCLVGCSWLIADRIVVWIVEKYVIPEYERQGRPMLNRLQIGRAAREVLGEDWFDLPFDDDEELLDWDQDGVLRKDPVRIESPFTS